MSEIQLQLALAGALPALAVMIALHILILAIGVYALIKLSKKAFAEVGADRHLHAIEG